ncbi:MAG: hypothetical protein ABJE95_32480 [Byssovorax sp.]
MKKYSWILVVAAVAPLFPLACGGGTTSTTSTGPGSGGSGGSATTATGTNTTGSNTTTTGTNTTGSNTTSTTSAAGTGGGPPVDCTGFFKAGDCGTCAEGSCCQETSDCKNDADCPSCFSGMGTPATCDANAAVTALNDCINNSCAMECNPPPDATCTVPAKPPSDGACAPITAMVACNPITNAPCTAGQACDVAGTGAFKCYDPPPANTAAVCAKCDLAGGTACAGGETCDNGICVKYCCTDADCGAGKCDKTTLDFGGAVGVCIGGNGGTTSSTAASSSSTGP